jgi:signal transduction histidine kinase
MVRGSANHLLSLINDVLDISKIEAGELRIYRSRFNIRELLEKAVRSCRPAADKKGLTLSVSVSENVEMITSDKVRVEQVLLNLLGNAVKFTETGGISLECRRDDGFFLFTVTDTGIGIREEDMEGLFRAFHQLDSGTMRRYEGTGLGLSICKKLVGNLGGKIWVTSVWGAGSSFCFTLPDEGGEI